MIKETGEHLFISVAAMWLEFGNNDDTDIFKKYEHSFLTIALKKAYEVKG